MDNKKENSDKHYSFSTTENDQNQNKVILSSSKQRRGLFFDSVINRLKTQFSLKSDKAFSEAIGMKTTTFNNRKKTLSLPYIEIIEFAQSKKVNLNWVFFGDNPIFVDKIQKHPQNQAVTLESSRQFKDPKTADQFTEYLIEIEKEDPEGYLSLFDRAKTIYQTINRLKSKFRH